MNNFFASSVKPLDGSNVKIQAERREEAIDVARGGDFATFLKMLTTQMQNQDPLNPVQASDFAVQLATFSGVEQQVQTNQLLSRLTESLLQDDMAAWLGTEVADGATVKVTGETIVLSVAAPFPDATRRELVFSSSSGQESVRVPLNLDQRVVHFDPSASGATPLLSGQYSAVVEDFQGSERVNTQSATQFHAVQEVRRAAEGVQLVLGSGQIIRAQDVSSVRKP